jgi:hypothetical protein
MVGTRGKSSFGRRLHTAEVSDSARNVLVVNCGSSSMQSAVLDPGSHARSVSALVERIA